MRRLIPRWLLTLGGFLLTLTATAQVPVNPWSDVPASRATVAASQWAGRLQASRSVVAPVATLAAVLALAPLEGSARAVPLVLALPTPDGGTARFQVMESPVMEAGLAARFPQIKTYVGQGLDDPSATLRADLTPQGFHAQVLSRVPGHTFYLDPVRAGQPAAGLLSYWRQDLTRPASGTVPTCGVTEAEMAANRARLAPLLAANAGNGGAANRVTAAWGTSLRTYRLAVAATGEYTAFQGGTVALGLAAIVTTVNRVVGVYEKELAVRLVLVANNNNLVYTNAATDPYANTSGDLAANQNNITTIIGLANFDIGHLVGTGGGGVAGLGVVCSATAKAQGLTGSSVPTGDGFDIDYVAHEMGHQFGGNHPFNGSVGPCAGSNRNTSTAWEPGSGSTIMAYAGICAPQDLQSNSDPYFHGGNLEEMRAFIAAGGAACGTATATGNTAPTFTTTVANKSIPAGTPFQLTAAATDAESNPLTYCWEAFDLGAAGAPVTSATVQTASATVPLFRSFLPVSSGTRYFPRLNELRNNTTVVGEALPTVARTMAFRCTVRDNQAGGGGVNQTSAVTLTVVNTGAAFAVTAPNTAVSYPGGSTQTVTWAVAGTTAAPISCATVNLRLSTDGGLTFPTVLAAAEPNDGSASVTIPNTPAATCRVLVEANSNYFFDLSDANFTITAGVSPPAITSLSFTSGPVGTSVTLTGTGFTGATGVSFNGTAAGTFSVTNATTATATVPAGASTGNVTITTPSGTSNGVSFAVTVPTTTITSIVRAGSNPTNAASVNYTVTFAAAVAGLTTSTFSLTITGVAGASVSSVSGAGTTYTVAVTTGTADGTLTLRLANATGLAPGLSTALPFAGEVYTIDKTAPTATITSATGADGSTSGAATFAYTVTFSEPVTGFVAGDVSVGNGTLSGFGGSGTTYTFSVIPTTNGPVPVSVAANGAADAATNGNTASGAYALTYSQPVTAAPVVTAPANGSTLATTTPTYSGTAVAGSTVTVFVDGTSIGTATATGGNFSLAQPTALSYAAHAVAATAQASGEAGSAPSAANTFTIAPADLTISTTQTVPAGTYRDLTVTGPATGGAGTAVLGGPVTVTGTLTVQAGGTLLTNCQPLTGGARFTLAAEATLGICDAAGLSSTPGTGAVQTTGPRSFAADATYCYNGSVAQVTGNALPTTVRELALSNAAGLTLSQPVQLTQRVLLSSGNLTLGGQALTLRSAATGTALVANLGGRVLGATATLQRHLETNTAAPGYRHYASPMQAGAGAETLATLATAGYAPDFSGAVAYNSSATPGTVTPFPTVFRYNQDRIAGLASTYGPFDKGWQAALGTEVPQAGRGYAVQAPGAALVDFTGTLTSGPVSRPNLQRASTDATTGWHLLGNPYPSPLDWSTMSVGTTVADNLRHMDGAVYVSQSNGPYAGSYRTYLAAAPGLGSPILPAGSGFFVHTTAPATPGTVRFNDANRVTSFGAQPAFGRGPDLRPQLTLEVRGAGGRDAVTVYADPAATAGTDAAYDALKLPNPTGLNLSAQAGPNPLAIDGLPTFSAATVVPLSVGVPAAGSYALQVNQLLNLPAGTTAVLVDALLNTRTDLATLPAAGYVFSVSPAQAATLITGRFYLNLGAAGPLATAAGRAARAVQLYPNPVRGGAATLTGAVPGAVVAVFDALGRKVMSAPADATGTAALALPAGVATGVYVVRVGSQAIRLTVE